MQVEVGEMQERSRRYIRKRTSKKGGVIGKTAQQQVKRTKSFHWLCAIDNALQAGAGVGLRDFVIQPAELAKPTRPLQWRSFSIVLDKGSDGVCATNFLVNELKLNIQVDFDPQPRGLEKCDWRPAAGQLGRPQLHDADGVQRRIR